MFITVQEYLELGGELKDTDLIYKLEDPFKKTYTPLDYFKEWSINEFNRVDGFKVNNLIIRFGTGWTYINAELQLKNK